MKPFVTVLCIIALFTKCNNNAGNSTTNNNRLALIPEPDKAERLRYEAIDKLKVSGCVLTNPDTSVAGIILRDNASAIAVIGNKDKLRLGSCPHEPPPLQSSKHVPNVF